MRLIVWIWSCVEAKPLSKPHAMTWALGWNTTQRQDSRGAENSNSCSAEVLFHTRMVPSSAAVTTSVDAGRRNGVEGGKGDATATSRLQCFHSWMCGSLAYNKNPDNNFFALNPPSMA